MKYLVFYLAAGIVVFVVTLLQSRFETKKHGPSLSESLTELQLQNASAGKRFAHKVVVPSLAGLLVILGWPIAVFIFIKDAPARKSDEHETDSDEFVISRQDLLEKLTMEQIEEREMVDDPLGAVPEKPFGHLNAAWQKFCEGLQPDDELWSFQATCKRPWDGVETRAGYVVSRGSSLGPCFTCSTDRAES